MLKAASELKVAVMVWVPAARLLVENDAAPELLPPETMGTLVRSTAPS